MQSLIAALSNKKFRNSLVLFLLVVAGWLLFGSSLGYEFFIFDDAFHITGNPRFHPVSAKHLLWIWTNSFMSVTYSFWALIAAIWGTESPIPYRAANIALHTLNSYLVFVWVFQILRPLRPEINQDRRATAAVIASLVFLIHPVHVENVAWISSGKDLLSFFFGMISFHFYFKSREESDSRAFTRNSIFSGFFVLVAILSKASAAILPVIYIWLDRALFKRPLRQSLVEYSAGAVAAAVAVYGYLQVVPASNLGFIPSPGWRVLLSFDALGVYLSKLLLPFNYYFDYGRTPIEVLRQFVLNPGIPTIAVATGMLAVSVFAIAYYRRKLACHIVIGIILLGLLPYLGLIPFAFQNISSVADRYLYFPSIGLSLAAALGFLRARRPYLTAATAGALLVILGAQTLFQVRTWESSIICLSHSVSRNPTSSNSRTALAHALFAKGLTDEALSEMRMVELLRDEKVEAHAAPSGAD